jgi:2-aminoadipate transaminase
MGELRNCGSWGYYYPDSVSDPGLSAAFCQFTRPFGLDFSADETITMGGVQPWFPALLGALVPEGSTVLIQEPHTLNPTKAYPIRGFDPVGVRTGADGLDVEFLKVQCKRFRPAAVVAQPNFGFADGVRWSGQNRRDVADVLQHYGVKLIERTALSILAFDSERPGLVSNLMSEDLGFAEFGFQACLAPGLLVSFACVRGAERQTVVKSVAKLGLTLPKPERLTCTEFIKRGALASNVQRTTRELQRRRDALVRALSSSLPDSCRCTVPQGGLSACVVLPRKLDPEDLFRRALDKRIAVMPGKYLSSEGSGDDRVVLSYSMLRAPALEEAGAVFGRLVRSLL